MSLLCTAKVTVLSVAVLCTVVSERHRLTRAVHVKFLLVTGFYWSLVLTRKVLTSRFLVVTGSFVSVLVRVHSTGGVCGSGTIFVVQVLKGCVVSDCVVLC